ncbi:hypothetical protein Adeg_0728 [Ammonifex degensii KC4]|uniref:TrbC/VIRB2 family protein n=1 Tax=Ammonifex degensii (strain DSM 10501 / KC4) TaxID=429009 RepID=C9RC97_AMMDK|nr:pilin [Ammonifex degensii]ACX51874.1 hypothetical protein Adeg_0728 [Ammonifex degensii KC4]
MRLKTLSTGLLASLSTPFLLAGPALAQGPVKVETPETLTQKLFDLIKNVGMPLGGVIFFGAICLGAIELMLARGRPEERARVMSGLMYVAIGGVILGAALFLAGAFIGIGQKLAGQG